MPLTRVSSGCVLLLLAVFIAPTLAKPSPVDLDWLRKEAGDGALATSGDGRIYLTELSTGKWVEVGPGSQPEFSPDSSKLAWVDGDRALGRMRKGDGAVHVIATNVDHAGGVHWISNDEVVLLKRDRKWYRITLAGEAREVPELTRMGRGGKECDVKLGEDGVWSYTVLREWATSDGKKGKTGGRCSTSLSPDGKSVTGLQSGHRVCKLTRIRSGGHTGQLRWRWDGPRKNKGFDNHRWSSNDPRFIVAEDEKHHQCVVMMVGTDRATRMGPQMKRNPIYGDFTVGNGEGAPWPGTEAAAADGEDAPKWPASTEGLLFLWDNNEASNSLPAARKGEPARVFRLERLGWARFDRHHAMLPGRGQFLAGKSVADAVRHALHEKGTLHIAALVTMDADEQANGYILSLGLLPRGWSELAIAQGHGNLRLEYKAAGLQQVILRRRIAGQALHVALSLERKGDAYELTGSIDGEALKPRSMDADIIANWKISQLAFGRTASFLRWNGAIEAVSIYDRIPDAKEQAANRAAATARLRGRQAPPRVVVRATVTRRCTAPAPENYPDSVVIFEYRVDQVVEGKLKAKTVLVAHWGAINGERVGAIERRSVGDQATLPLEPLEAHPELRTLQRNEASEIDLDAPVYFDVSEPGG